MLRGAWLLVCTSAMDDMSMMSGLDNNDATFIKGQCTILGLLLFQYFNLNTEKGVETSYLKLLEEWH